MTIATKRQASCWGRNDILVATEVIVYGYNNPQKGKVLLNYSFIRFGEAKIQVLCEYNNVAL